MTARLTKAEKAFRIVKKHDDSKKPTEIVRMIMRQCDLREGAAWTYLYNQRKRVGSSPDQLIAELAFTRIDERAKHITDMDDEDYGRTKKAS